ncbi:hypothetical protein F5144DRAFT_126666 [Chaetomium tenue]|uniref:Uncharacterized protein n=1 Tax=Chaetomium tenue TaxID=1854479 RepID=A0ACB7PKN6_9PEZI|nr:hypothetical protein F5144DRAFT_126666 [Chaetomium globosum]
MNLDERIDLVRSVEVDVWVRRVNDARRDGRMASWISSLHPRRLGCELVTGSMNGTFNLCQKVIFDDKTTAILRMPIGGRNHPDYADEKAVVEAATLSLLRRQTSIPVPAVYVWGTADHNILGLGPFILMQVVDGVSGSDLHWNHGPETRLLREDISEANLELLFRQIARYQLELFSLNFDTLGSLPLSIGGVDVPTRPLTWKAHASLHGRGIDTIGLPSPPSFLPETILY